MKENSIEEDMNSLLKENEALKVENSKLKVIKYDTNYGTETVNLIPESTLVKINTNRYMIEIEEGKFVDLKQVYQENKELKNFITEGITVETNSPYKNYQLDFLRRNFIPIQKVKDILNEINKEYIRQEEIFNKYFEKENRDMQDYYIQKEATNIMQELSWVEGNLEELLEGKK